MIVYIIKKTDKKGNAREIEVYKTKTKALQSAKTHQGFGKLKGEKYEVIERELNDNVVLPSYS